MKRKSNWTPTIVANRAHQTRREKLPEVDITAVEPSLSALLNVTYRGDGGSSNNVREVLDQKSRHDVCFTIGITVALALPVLFGIGVYFATTAILGALT
jgi:hypothetical protein